jgi:hypothetical protein
MIGWTKQGKFDTEGAKQVSRRSVMDVTGSTLQLNTSDGKMEIYEARPKEGGSYPGIVVLMEAFGLNEHIKK